VRWRRRVGKRNAEGEDRPIYPFQDALLCDYYSCSSCIYRAVGLKHREQRLMSFVLKLLFGDSLPWAPRRTAVVFGRTVAPEDVREEVSRALWLTYRRRFSGHCTRPPCNL